MLQTKLPPTFTPYEYSSIWKDTKNTIQWWVYPDNKTAKSYIDCTVEEVASYLKKINPSIELKDIGILTTLTARSIYIDLCLSQKIYQYRNILGSPEFWESINDWKISKEKSNE